MTFLLGGAGSDVFRFSGNWGDDTINHFTDGYDKIEFFDKLFSFSAVITFSSLTITQDGDDTFIEDTVGNSITIENFTATNLTEDDFIFG